MAEKEFKTRILLKYDSLTNWNNSTGYLRAGEVAIATVPEGTAGQEVGSVATPQVLVKVGDGKHRFADLPFITAKAGDVYAWAKREKPSYVKAVGSDGKITYGDLSTDFLNALERIGNLETFKDGNAEVIANAIAEAKKYTEDEIKKLNHTTNGDGNVVTNVTQSNGIVTVTKGSLKIEDLTDGTETIEDIEERLTNLETFEENAGKNLATKEELSKEKKALQDEIDSDIATARGLITTEIGGAVEAAKTTLIGDANTNNTILWAKNAADDAAAAAVNANNNANTRVLTSTYNTDQEAQNNRLTALEGKIDGVTGAMHFKGVVTEDPTGITSGYADGDVVIYSNKEYVFSSNKFVELGDTTAELQAIDDLQTAVNTTIPNTYVSKTELTNIIDDLDSDSDGSGNFITGVSQTNGKVTVTKGSKKITDLEDGNRVSTLETNLGTAQTNITDLQTAVNTTIPGDIATAKSDLIGKSDDTATAVTIYGAKKAAADVLGTSADTTTANTVYGVKAAVTAEKARAEQAEGNLQTQINTINQNKTTVSTTENAGLKVTPNGNDYKVDIDDSITFIFNCGTSVGLDANPSVTA